MSSGYFVEDYEPSYVSVWQRINRVLWVLLILTMVAFIIGSFLPELDKQRTEREARERLHRLIDEQRAILSRHQREIGWIKNDPEYLTAKYMRDKFDVMKEGETILRLEPAKAGTVTPEMPAVPAAPRR